ncbi:MAG: extracellular solute-binding protein [Symbiopectobacterium sp.]
MFIYNKGTWDKAGVAYPKTWDELFAPGSAFKKALSDNFYPPGRGRRAPLTYWIF